MVYLVRAQGFIWPLRPFTALTSTFYEYRTTHFHSGVDLSTYRRTGLPVRAAASGEIFRIFYHWYGFGRALYIRHSNGYITVYGHLLRFENKRLGLEDLIKRLEKKTGKKYIGNYYLEKPIKVKKGQIIGYSGSMGAGGPHLHFEIRKGETRPLNPLKFLRATIGPVILRSYILEVASPGSFVGLSPTRLYGKFPERRKIPVHGCFRLFLQGYEKCKGRCGIYHLEAYFDGKKVSELRGDSFQFSQNYTAGWFFNLALSSSKKPYYVIPPFSSPPLCIEEGEHTLRIVGQNIHGNSSQVSLTLYHRPSPLSLKGICCLEKWNGKSWEKSKGGIPSEGYIRFKVKTEGFSSPWIILYRGKALKARETLRPKRIEAHVGWKRVVFPDDFLVSPMFCQGECFSIVKPKGGEVISQGFYFKIDESAPGIRVKTHQESFPNLSLSVSKIPPQKIPHELLPLSDFYLITPKEALLKSPAVVDIKFEGRFDRTVGIYRKFSRGWSYLEPTSKDAWLRVKSRLLGVFVVAKDTAPPKIGRIRISKGMIYVRIRDGGSGVNPEKIYISIGKKKFIPEYDYDAGLAFGKIKIPGGKHLLKVKAQDFAGNLSTRAVWVRGK